MQRVQKTVDRAEIRRRLNTNRVWSIYALADLDADLFEQCDWWLCGNGLALVFKGIAIQPIFVIGSQSEIRELLENLPIDRGYLNLRIGVQQDSYRYEEPHRMSRMVVDNFRPRSGEAVELGAKHLDEVLALYATGNDGGVAFGAFQLETGFFRGVRYEGSLVAVAGVHVVSRAESVAGVGNVFTRADQRGRGLAQIATSAVVAALIADGIETIGLNVEHDNAPAIRAYQKLGFREAFQYREGTAVRKRIG